MIIIVIMIIMMQILIIITDIILLCKQIAMYLSIDLRFLAEQYISEFWVLRAWTEWHVLHHELSSLVIVPCKEGKKNRTL